MWARLPVGVFAWTDHASRRIVMDAGLLQAERRSTLAHELEHVARGPLPADPVLAAREEIACEEAAARRLIPLEALLDALRWSSDVCELADELWVDVQLARVRLERLHPSERAWLAERLGGG